MWFTFVTARLFSFPRFQPRLAAALWRLCSVVNSPTRRVGLAPTLRPASPALPSLFSVELSDEGPVDFLILILLLILIVSLCSVRYGSVSSPRRFGAH